MPIPKCGIAASPLALGAGLPTPSPSLEFAVPGATEFAGRLRAEVLELSEVTIIVGTLANKRDRPIEKGGVSLLR